MRITLFVRTYPVKDAPVAYSLVPFPPNQKHTFTCGGKVYNAVSSELEVTVPDGSVIDIDRKLLCWEGDEGRVKSTVNEVYELVKSHAQGFGGRRARRSPPREANSRRRTR